MSVHPEVLLASGYALFLLGAAWGLSVLGRRERDAEDSWPRWEAARLHQGVSAVLVLLAALLLGACALRHPEGTALGVLGLVSLPVLVRARHTWVQWRTESSTRRED